MSPSPKILSVKQLELTNFRNYKELSLNFEDKPVVITGKNGIGKTNILEALSLLSPGRGIRNAKFSDIDNQESGQAWNLYSTINGVYDLSEIIIYKESSSDISADKRNISINGSKIRSKSELAKIFSIIWLTPQMDYLFMSSTSDRRKFFDRLVYNFNPEHATHINKYEYFMKERNRLLKDINYDKEWLSIIEKKMSESATLIASSRILAEKHLNQVIKNSDSNFPNAIISIQGDLEKLFLNQQSKEITEIYKDILLKNRKNDAIIGRTSIGPHRSDLIVTHQQKNQLASYCSTGEQKALLISTILADIKAKIKLQNSVPVLLLDEIAAHLDNYRRDALLEELISLRCQFFITGITEDDFNLIKNKSQFLQLQHS